MVYQGWFPGQFRENLTAAIPLYQFGVIGLGADYSSYSAFQQYDANGNPIVTHQPYQGSFTLGFAFPFLDTLSLGFTGRGMLDSQSADGQNISGYLTAGFLWSGIQPIKIGAFYSFTDSDVPADKSLLKLGASCPLTFSEGNPTLFLLDYSLPPRGVYTLQVGVEQTLLGSFSARAGYQWTLDDNSMPGSQGLAAGLGAKWKGWSFDYAFSPYGKLGTSQTVGLSFSFLEGSRLSPQNPTSLSPAAFKPADALLPGDKVVNVEVNLSLPQDTSPSAQGPVSPQLAENISNLAQKVAQNPANAQAWNTLGNLYWQAGRADYAVQCFGEALQLQPSNQGLKDWLDRYKKIHSTAGEGKE